MVIMQIKDEDFTARIVKNHIPGKTQQLRTVMKRFGFTNGSRKHIL